MKANTVMNKSKLRPFPWLIAMLFIIGTLTACFAVFALIQSTGQPDDPGNQKTEPAVSGFTQTKMAADQVQPETPTSLPKPTHTFPPTADPTATFFPVPTLDVELIVASTGRQPMRSANLDQIVLLDEVKLSSELDHITFNPDSNMIAFTLLRSSDEDDEPEEKSIQVRKIASTEIILAQAACLPSDVMFSPDGKTFMSSLDCAMEEDTLIIKDIETGEETRFDVKDDITTLTSSPDGQWLFGGGSGLWQWNIKTGEATSLATGKKVIDIEISPDGRWIYYTDGMLIGSVDLLTGESHDLEIDDLYLISQIEEIVMSPNGSVMAVVTYNDLAIWDLRAEQWIGKVEHARAAAAISQDGLYLAAAIGNDQVGIWDLNTLELKTQLLGAFVSELAFSPDGTMLASVASNGNDSRIQIWGIASNKNRLPVIAVVGEDNSFGLSKGIPPTWLVKPDQKAKYQIEFTESFCREVDKCIYEQNHTLVLRQCVVNVRISDLPDNRLIEETAFFGAKIGPDRCDPKRPFNEQIEFWDEYPRPPQLSEWLMKVLNLLQDN